jgi:hypothetical protein
MRPRFGAVTQVISAVFALAGLGAALALLGSGSLSDDLELLALAVSLEMVAVGLWAEFVWAWWIGACMVALMALLSWVLGSSVGVGFVWPAVLLGFAITLVQGWRDKREAVTLHAADPRADRSS